MIKSRMYLVSSEFMLIVLHLANLFSVQILGFTASLELGLQMREMNATVLKFKILGIEQFTNVHTEYCPA